MSPEEYKEKTRYNRSVLKSKIKELAEFCDWFSFQPKKFWPYTKIVTEAFRTYKPLTPEDRSELWDEFQSLCKTAKEKGDSERIQFVTKSETARNEIFYLIKEANSYSKINVPRAQELLGQAMSNLKASKLTKEHNNECFEYWKKIKDELNWEKNEKRSANYRYIKSMIVDVSNTAVYGDAKEALDEIKHIQSQLKNYPMDEVYWKEVKSSLATYWNKAKSRLDEHYRQKRQDYESDQQKWKEKQANWRYNQEQHLEKFERMVSDNEDYIDKLRDQIRDLESDIASAWNDGWKSKAQGWVAEKEAKIAEVQDSISGLEYKIRDIRNSLNN